VKIKTDSVFVRVTGDPQFLQGVEDLKLVRTDLLVHAIFAESIGHPDRELLVATTDASKRIGYANVRVLTKSGNEKNLARTVVCVQIAAVVKVAIAARRVRQ
jgi:hypothetical protein